MESYGPFAQEAHKIEHENILLRRENEELKAKLQQQEDFCKNKEEEMHSIKEKYNELLIKLGEIQQNYSAFEESLDELKKENKELKEKNAKLTQNYASNSCCCCCSRRNKNKELSDTCSKIIDIASEALGYEAEDLDRDDNSKLAIKLVKILAKKKGKESSKDEHEEFEKLKRKYQKKTEQCKLLRDECDDILNKRLSKKKTTQKKKKSDDVYKSEIRKLHTLAKDLKVDYKELADIDHMKHVY